MKAQRMNVPGMDGECRGGFCAGRVKDGDEWWYFDAADTANAGQLLIGPDHDVR
jgi:hypothetical protein